MILLIAIIQYFILDLLKDLQYLEKNLVNAMVLMEMILVLKK